MNGVWVILHPLFFVCLFAQGTNELHTFITDFFARQDIPFPLNEEYSIKFSSHGIGDKRYIVCIPTTYLTLSRVQQVDGILKFIPDGPIALIIRNYTYNNGGWLLYAIDSSEPTSVKKKVYFDFGKNSGKGLDSYEWEESIPSYRHRTYRNWEYDALQDVQLMTKHQHKMVQRHAQYIDFAKTLCKESEDKKSLYFACQPQTTVAELTPFVWSCIQKFYHDKKKFDAVMRNIQSFTLTCVHVQPSEVTIYYRKKDWTYDISAIDRS